MAGSIKGQVTNQRDGLPIHGASIELEGHGETWDAESDAHGKFAFEDLPTPDDGMGKFDAKISKQGFEDGIYGPIVVVHDNATEVHCALEPKGV